ncbi:hypothetical protein WG78_07185 [Amantichitinum ursilacus]|uniref:Uncharacterized protein n=2 Tax=Amantichitinum ursilacus TaxID=857265 RepID=A0A0N1JT28_9NEIS|nr:hypothetical protein WG78_07185 [Amantichitinum ursilacus]
MIYPALPEGVLPTDHPSVLFLTPAEREKRNGAPQSDAAAPVDAITRRIQRQAVRREILLKVTERARMLGESPDQLLEWVYAQIQPVQA